MWRLFIFASKCKMKLFIRTCECLTCLWLWYVFRCELSFSFSFSLSVGLYAVYVEGETHYVQTGKGIKIKCGDRSDVVEMVWKHDNTLIFSMNNKSGKRRKGNYPFFLFFIIVFYSFLSLRLNIQDANAFINFIYSVFL